MTDFDDEKLISALRSAGTDGPAFAMTPLSETTRRGRAARRRRTVLAGGGATALAAATVTAALAVQPLMQGPDAVPSPGGSNPTNAPAQEPSKGPTNRTDEETPMSADEMITANRAAILEALPEGFVELTEENRDEAAGMAGFALAENAPAADGLPEGMSGGIDLLVFAADEAEQSMGGDLWCTGFTEKGTVTTDCVDLAVDGETVQVQHWSQPGSDERRAYESTRTTYEQPNGDVVVLDVPAWEDEVTAQPRSEEARAWVDAMHEQIVSIVLHPTFQPTEWNERRHVEAVDLAADLGAQWAVLDEPPASSVYPTEDLSATLPDGVTAGVTRDVLRDADLDTLCAGRTEAGIHREPCAPVPGTDAVVSYGEMIDPQHRGDDSHDMRLADVVVYHEYDDGSIVKARLFLSHMALESSHEPRSLWPWLEDQVPDLLRAATALD